MEDYTYDYISGADIYLYQYKKTFRTNTDTVLLAQFMKAKRGERVLDIDTDNGALLPAIRRYVLLYLYGIDIRPEVVAATEKNMEHHHITNMVLVVQDICDTVLERADVIVYNPPCFKVGQESNLNESQGLQVAYHERFLTLGALRQQVSGLLDEKERFYMVHRASRISEVAYTLKQHRLEIHTLQFVYDTNREEAVGVLVEAVKDGRVNVHIPLPQIIER